MKDLLCYLKSYVKETVLGPLFKLLEAFLELLVPLVVARIIDIGITHGNKPYAVRMCLLMVVLGFVGLVFSITAQYFAAKASVGFVSRVRHEVFSHIRSLSYSDLDTIGTSTLITRITSDINQVQNGMNLTLRLFLRSPFVVFGAMVMAFTIDFKAALVFAAAIPLLSVVVFGIMLICIPLYKKVQRNLDSVTAKTRENLTGVRVIRAFCKEDEEIADFDERNEELTAASKFVGKISALMNPLTYIIINLATVVLIRVGALRVHEGILTQGAVIALYNYMSQILVELIKLANLIINITKSVACGNRINDVLKAEPSMKYGYVTDGKPGIESCVEFCHAYMKYYGAAECSIEDADFTANRGETIGIIGGTGSGKSTLVSLIGRFYDCCDGAVLVDGVDVRDYTKDALRRKIGIVPQRAVLFEGTIRENMLWGNPNATDDEIMAALDCAQAKDVVESKQGGLNGRVEQGGKNFSGGQRQRLTIARALVRKPEILILDDSASALDFATDAALRKSLRTHCAGTTVFIVSQRTSSIRHADKIIVLDDGKTVGMGTHDELLETCEVYREIYNSQFKKEAG